MTQISISCVGCNRKTQAPTTGYLKDITDKTDFFPVFYIKNGMEVIYLCPKCYNRCQEGITILKEVFGSKINYVHFLNLLAGKQNV